MLEFVYPGALRIRGMKRENSGTDLHHLDKSCSHFPSHMHPVSVGSCIHSSPVQLCVRHQWVWYNVNVLLSCMFFFMDVSQLLFKSRVAACWWRQTVTPDSCSPSAVSLCLSRGLLGIVIYTSRGLIQTRGAFETPRHHHPAAMRARAKSTLAGWLLNSCEMLFPFVSRMIVHWSHGGFLPHFCFYYENVCLCVCVWRVFLGLFCSVMVGVWLLMLRVPKLHKYHKY